MDLKSIGVAFAMVFLAELGDKTQLATMMLSAKTGSTWAVFLGAAAALVLSALLGALAGAALTRVIPVSYIQTVSGFFFVLIGLLLLFRKI